ncbi:MAG: AAA family ATPase [Cyanobacteria bacterium SZAS LIN-3]|nr:AAA family ATPase [Cyanobacteria bacterium SZAS LIN-3]
MKNWAKWLFLIVWTLALIFTAQYWNPFVSVPALLKYTVVSVVAAGVYGALFIIIQFYIILSIIFPLPPRADSNAPKSVWRNAFKFFFKDSPISPKAPKTLSEMIGNEKAKIEIQEVIDILAKSSHYEESGAQVPKGMLFIGAPGVGKTLFARAIANEVGVPFYVVDGGAIGGIFMGLGVLKLKTLFRKLKNHDRAILFIDEIDSMGAKRQQDQGFGGVADMNMTLNTLLTEMDGFHGSRLMVIGATNNDAMLDPALMRAGRMDRRIYFQMPMPEERTALFKYYLAKVNCDEANIDYEQITMLTNSYSPAEIANVVNEAALISMRPGNPTKVNTEMILQALDKVSVGLERSLGNSGVELINHDPTVKLSDVVGIDDVKQDIAEIVDFLKRGDELRSIGAKLPSGVLMIGPPGVGKSMLAKAIANEAGVPFYGLSASMLISMWRGEGSARIRALYTQARKSPAAIVFIDEIDTIAGTTDSSGLGGRRSTELNQILVELDGLGRSNVVTICATNKEGELDSAFYRSGRFDRKLYVGLPDRDARKELFRKYIGKLKLDSEQDLDKLAKLSVNFSGADVAAACNEAGILAVRAGKKAVTEEEFETAIEKVSVTSGHKLNTGGINMSRVPDLDVKLDDIKGMDEAKAEAAEVVAMLKHVDLVAQTGLKAPRGVLLVGRPGTGKTMLAKAIANEAGVAFYALSGGDFQSMWAGVGTNRVRAVFEQARRSGKPAIVFIDEIDAIGSMRGRDLGGGAIQDSNKTLNQLLVEMDGFGKHKVLTIGATNNPDMLDPALLRPGRFDRKIEVPMPNLEGREAILEHYMKDLELTLDPDVNAMEISRMTVFQSGADLANIVNEAGLGAIRAGRLTINHADLVTAIQRVRFGISRSQKVNLQELWETAYHEAGHTIIAYFRNLRDRIQVVTIVPSGYALGYMWSVGKEDAFYSHMNKQDMLARIEVSLGGYCAEELHKETTSTGVSTDLEHVGQVASSMVRKYGMGSFMFNTHSAFVTSKGRGSEATEREIDLEIKKLVDDCITNVRGMLRAKRSELDRIAQGLVEKETLYYKDLVHILEPHRTDADIDREIATMADRKLVGKPPVINIDVLPGLPGKGAFGNGKKGDKGKAGSGSGSAGDNGSSQSSPSKSEGPDTGFDGHHDGEKK